MTFQRIVHLKANPGLPLVKKLYFDEPDPNSPLHTRPLTVTDYTLVAVVGSPPKSKAYEIEILQDPPAPGIYEFMIIFMGVEYPFEVELLPGEGAKELQEKIIKAIKALGLGHVFAACAPSCAEAYEIVVAGWWPGLEFQLLLVSQPVTDPPEDQIDVDELQGNAPLAELTVTSQVVGDQLEITVKLSAAQTGGIPVAGDGPYRWHLTGVRVLDPGDPDADPPVLPTNDPDDVLELARGNLVMERV